MRDPEPRMVRERTALFRAPGAAPVASVAVIADLTETSPLSHDFGPAPAFARDESTGRFLVRVEAGPGTSFYGTGEVAGPLRRNGQRITLWNTDSFGYTIRTPSLYQSHPWVLGLRDDGSAFGVLIDTTRRCEIDLFEGILASVEGAPPDVFVIDADSPQGVLHSLAQLTGTMPLPPKWALGFHQCRYSYGAEHEVLGIADEFRSRWIPCDAVWMDIDYMQQARSFTVDPHAFPDPARMIGLLRSRGFRTVWIIDPGLRADEANPEYRDGLERNAFVRDAGGAVFLGDVWPGRCAWPDFLREDVRRWWGELTASFAAMGAEGVWNDMNEPSVFDGPERTLPPGCIHDADQDLGGPGTHARYHNIYGMQMARATFEGLRRARPEQRPFVLSRSNYLGGQRYACCWTGDSASTWEHLAWTIPMMLNLGLSGQPFAGCDIGGFAENADAELFARWMGIGALLPFARAHSDKGTNRHEPWSFGHACEHACRLALERRYRLIHYLYTCFREASRTGLPVMRPLFLADPSDPALRGAEDSFLLGRDLLVRASVRPDNRCGSPMPRGLWRPVEPAAASDENLPGLFLRGGAILPLGPIMQHSSERPLDPITLVVSLDEQGYAEGNLYEDSGDGYAHEEGDFLFTTYAAKRVNRHVTVWVKHAEGRRPRPLRIAEILVLRDDGTIARATGVGGDVITVLVGEPGESPIERDD